MKVLSMFPAAGETQCAVGQENGVFCTWMIHGNVIGKVHHHTDREQAMEVHQANIDVINWKIRGDIGNGTSQI